MLSDINQTEKDKYCMISIIEGLFEKKKKKKGPNRHREQIRGCQSQGEG